MKKIFFLGFFLFVFMASTDRYSHLELFAQALHKIKTQHVKPETWETMIFSAIKGILLELDPYSQILSPKDFDLLKQESSGEHYGIGLEVERSDPFLLILAVLKNSPAHKVGLLPGDQILKLNERSTKKMTTVDFKKFLKANKSFKIVVKRGDKLLMRNVEPKLLKVESTSFKEIKEGIFYLKIHQFTSSTGFEVSKALKNKKIKALLIDVRYNRGGVLEESYKIADLFLQEGVIARYKIRTEKKETTVKARNAPYLGGFPIALLINEMSASASELLAASLQDPKRAV